MCRSHGKLTTAWLCRRAGGIHVEQRASGPGQSRRLRRQSTPMSNVLPFHPRRPAQTLARCEVVAVAADLLTLLDQLEDVSARAAAMGRPALEVERTVQHLLDAVSAVERALDCIGEGEQAAPA